MLGQNKTLDFQVVATTMMGVVSDTMKTMCSQRFSDSPTFTTKYILDNGHGRMEIKASSKSFFSGCCVSFVNYYLSTQHQERNKPCGTVVLYVRNECLVKLFQAMGFPITDDKDLNMITDVSAEFCNIIGGGFKNAIANLGFLNLVMSAPQTAFNQYDKGVDYSEAQVQFHELSFYFWEVKAFVVDVTMAPIPMVKK